MAAFLPAARSPFPAPANTITKLNTIKGKSRQCWYVATYSNIETKCWNAIKNYKNDRSKMVNTTINHALTPNAGVNILTISGVLRGCAIKSRG